MDQAMSPPFRDKAILLDSNLARRPAQAAPKEANHA